MLRLQVTIRKKILKAAFGKCWHLKDLEIGVAMAAPTAA